MMQTMMTSVAAGYPAHYRMPTPKYRDRWAEMTQRRRALTRSAHASCWCAGEELEAMWKLFCKDVEHGQGLALRTTVQKLEKSVAQHDLIIGGIRYRHYHTGPAFTDDLDGLMHKRNGFRHESEVRLLHYDQQHYLQHAAFIGGYADVERPALPQYVSLEWAAFDAIDAIVVSPYTSQAYEDQAKGTIEAINAALLAKVELSELSPGRYEPLF